MKKKINDEIFMHRALQLAALGSGNVSPNPMVGAVIVHNGRIIGEGYHRRYGEGHAEVNAVASVTERNLLPESTIYVTLEPCSHYGKTPPCSELILRVGIPRVVVGILDPNPKVSGRGVKMLRDGGVEVRVGVLEDECREINRRFLTAHSLKRPHVLLKWAQSRDGFIGGFDADGNPTAVKISNNASMKAMHRERSLVDAIIVGARTIVSDNPSLTIRHWHGRNPVRVVLGNVGVNHTEYKVFSDENSSKTIFFPNHCDNLLAVLQKLYSEHGITSVMVEGGARLLQSFIDAELWDEARVETAPITLGDGTLAPMLTGKLVESQNFNGNEVNFYRHLTQEKC